MAAVEIRLIVHTAVLVTVAVALMLIATLPAPAVPSPTLSIEVVAAPAIVPLAWTVRERARTVVAAGMVTTALAGITTLVLQRRQQP